MSHRPVRRVVLVLVPFAATAACSALVSLDDLHGDASDVAAEAAPDVATDDGSVPCTLTLVGDAGADGWLFGSSARVAEAGYVELNTCFKSSAGGVMWSQALSVDPLTVDFDFVMSNNATDPNGYGLGVFVLDSPAQLAICNSGDQLCLIGASGWAVVVYVGGTNDAGAANGVYVGVVNTQNQALSPPAGTVPPGLVASVADCTTGDPPNAWHHMHVTSSGGKVNATIDQTSVLIDVPRPVALDTGFVGIGGSSGGGFFVRNDLENIAVAARCSR
jgi:hypothetical protein